MAATSGIATDYKNLLNKLKTFVVLHGWVINRDDTSGSEHELRLQGDGDANDEIFVGIKTYEVSDTGQCSWECNGATGFRPDRDFYNQSGTSKEVYIPLKDSDIDYWIWATGRRICMVARVGSAYQFMYLGFINQYATEVEYPYPLLVMGSSYVRDMMYNSDSLYYSSSAFPAGRNIASCSYILSPANGWLNVLNTSSTNSDVTVLNAASIWPMTVDRPINNSNMSYTRYGGLYYRFSKSDASSDIWRDTENDAGHKMVPMFPLIILKASSPSLLLGEIHNVYWCPLIEELKAGDVAKDGVSNSDYIIFQNIKRTDRWMGLAIKDE